MSKETTNKTAPAPNPLVDPIEEDDEFPEFNPPNWKDTSKTSKTNEASKLFETSWDDDDIEDEFTQTLRGELEKYRKTNTK
ncbi:hypothetical protein ScalyP_jg4443 [Parmales sp. scaly parma]|nr:hypothetical protein ScalyP_jg4443 [Parmales sp. scaly parma]